MTGDFPVTAPRGKPLFGWVLASALFLFLPMAAYTNKGIVLLLILSGLAALYHILAKHAGRPALPFSRFGLAAFLGLILWGAATTLWAETPGLAIPRTLEMAGLTLLGLAVLAALPSLDERERKRLGTAVMAGAVLFFVVMGVDLLSGGAMEAAVRRWMGRPMAARWESFRFKVGVSMCGIVMPVLLLWLWRKGRRVPAVLMPVCLAAAGIAIDSHTGLTAALIAGAVTVTALFLPRMSTAVIGGAVALAFLTTPLVMVRISSVPEIADSIKIMPNSMMHRLCIWRFTAEHVVERPLLGWGMDASRALPGGEDSIPVPVRAFGKIVMINAQAMPLHPHNLMLQVWLELGGVGAVGFIALAAAVLSAALRHRSVTAPALGVIAGALVVGAASFGAWQAWWVSAQWMFAILCIALLKGEDRPSALH